jgi:hypothetical protein
LRRARTLRKGPSSISSRYTWIVPALHTQDVVADKPPTLFANRMNRLQWYAVCGVTLGLSLWTGIDVYGRTLRPGSRAIWGILAGLLVCASLSFIWYKARLRATHGDGSFIVDARGEGRFVAHTETAAFLAPDLPPDARRDVQAAAVANLFRQYQVPHWSIIAVSVVLFAGLALVYWNAAFPLDAIILALFVGLGSGYTSRPRAMAAAYIKHGHCPGCAYRLIEVPRQADGCTICPECGAAWRVPLRSTVR